MPLYKYYTAQGCLSQGIAVDTSLCCIRGRPLIFENGFEWTRPVSKVNRFKDCSKIYENKVLNIGFICYQKMFCVWDT